MKKTPLVKVFSLIMTAIVFFTSIGISTVAQAEDGISPKESKIVRVFFPEQAGLSHVDENGKLSGYMYDYLMKIAQRTGWKYEFITGASNDEELQNGLKQLENGEIDLAGLVYSESLEQIYEYCNEPYGESNFTLITSIKKQRINERTLLSLPKLTVAQIEKATQQNTYFEEYAKTVGLEYNIVYGADTRACRQLLESGEADLMISKDVATNDGYKTVARFSPQPFFFASFKGNTELTKQLDEALIGIDTSDPYFRSRTHAKHFSKDLSNQINFTSEEIDYIKDSPPIRVVIFTDEAPMQSYDPKTKTYSGIVIDILNELSRLSGLTFELVSASSQKEAKTLLTEKKADIIAGIPYDYGTADEYNVLITSTIFSMPVVRVLNQRKKASNSEILVLNTIKMFEGKENVKFFENSDEILSYINRGDYSEGYVDGYMAQHYLQTHMRTNILITPTPYSNYDLCLGVTRNSDLKLISVLEQTIAGLPSSTVEDIVYQNTVHVHNTGLGAVIKSNPVQAVVFLIAFFAIIVLLLFLLFIRTRQINKILAEEKTVYKVISDTDRMTKTYNNVAFKQMVNDYLSITDGVPHGVLIVCDVDNFKGINDTHGHLVGDQVLHQMGVLLNQIFRSNDIVGRLGGDEFAVLIKDISDINVVKSRCSELIDRSHTVSEQCDVTLSVGAVMFDKTNTFNNLFKVADDALYQVKKRGKNGYEIVQLKNGDQEQAHIQN